MSTGTPARSTPQLDLMRRLQVRDAQHRDLSMPFLEAEEREQLDRVLNASVDHGVTSKVERQAHAFLVTLGKRDATLRFLTDEEREQLTSLTSLSPPAPDLEQQQELEPERQSMSAGEFVVCIGVVLAIAAAAWRTYSDPAISGSAIWVAVWGVVSGGSFIADTRHRNSTGNGAVSIAEGFLAVLIWAIASAAVILLGSSQHFSPGAAAFLCFIGAGIVGRAVLKIEDDDSDDDDERDD